MIKLNQTVKGIVLQNLRSKLEGSLKFNVINNMKAKVNNSAVVELESADVCEIFYDDGTYFRVSQSTPS